MVDDGQPVQLLQWWSDMIQRKQLQDVWAAVFWAYCSKTIHGHGSLERMEWQILVVYAVAELVRLLWQVRSYTARNLFIS